MIGSLRGTIVALTMASAAVLGSACGDDSGDQSLQLPDDMPVFGGASKESEEVRDGTLYVTYTASAPREEVVTYYRRSLDTDPWFVTNFTDQVAAGSATVVFRRIDDTVVGTVDVTHNGDSGSRFVIAIAPNNPIPPETTAPPASPPGDTASPSPEAAQ